MAVQAFRTPTREGPAAKAQVPLTPRVTASSAQAKYPAAQAADGDAKSIWVSNGWKEGEGPRADRPEWLLLEYPQPIKTATLWITPRNPYGPRAIEIQTSPDGMSFQAIKQFTMKRRGEEVIALPLTESRFFRILVTEGYSAINVQIAEVALQQPADKALRSLLAMKNGTDSVSDMGSVRAGVEAPLGPPPFDPAIASIDPRSIVDLTGRLKADGALAWDVPEGDWTVVRTGYTITGRKVSCSTKGCEGYEMDWLDAGAMDLHFKSMAEVLLADSAPLVGKSLKYLHDDSWEVGLPNWNPQFLDEFKKYRGYDARLTCRRWPATRWAAPRSPTVSSTISARPSPTAWPRITTPASPGWRMPAASRSTRKPAVPAGPRSCRWTP